MAPIQKLLYYVPSPVIGLIVVFIFVFFTASGLIAVRRSVPHHRMKIHNDVAGAIFNTLGVAYTVLLAFVVVMAWQNFEKSQSNVVSEANCLADMYRDAQAFPAEFREHVRSAVKEYADSIINYEWKSLAMGMSHIKSNLALKNLWDVYTGYEPVTESQKIFLSESIRNLNMAGELRTVRLLDSRTGIHPALWFVIFFGGIMTVVFTSFFGTENFIAQILMSSVLAVVVAFILMTILLLDFPFTGGISITPEAFKTVARF